MAPDPSAPRAVPRVRATLTDVAALAGVSRQTASRAVRGTAQVHPETLARVQRAVAALGYRPHPAARALSTGRGETVGVLTHESGTFGAMSILAGVEHAAEQAGYGVSVASLRAFDPASVQLAIDRLVATGCDGIVLMAPWASDGDALCAVSSPVPLVTTSDVPGYDGPAVHADTVLAAREAVEHLLGLGHRRVQHLAGPDGWNASRLRTEGWRAALDAAGLPGVPAPLVGDWSSESGHRAGRVLAGDDSVTAVFVANDAMALGLLHALHAAGRRVPEDVSVVGFDDAPGSAFFQPALTTVRVDNDEHGRRALEALIGGSASSGERIPHTLVVRASTSAPR